MDKKYFVGIDLGGTSIKLGIIDLLGNVMQKSEVPTPYKKYDETLELFDELIRDTGIDHNKIVGIGIGVPGFVNIHNGSIDFLPNVGWKSVNLKKDLENKTNLPVFVDNDANLAALGEMQNGAGRGNKNLIVITIGTGVGAGIIINGEIYHGKDAMAGEIGHLTINPDSTVLCNCGKYGCLETEVSATAMLNHKKNAIEMGRDTLLTLDATTKEIFEAVDKEDPLANEIINNTAYYLGLALSQIVTVLAPEKIVIGGGVSKANNLLLDPTIQYFKRFSNEKLAKQTEIVLAELENDAGMIGAANLVRSKLK